MRPLLVFLILFLFSSHSYAKERGVPLQWHFSDDVVKQTAQFRLEVVQVMNGEHHLVLSTPVKEQNFLWKTDRSGFFIMRVFPVGKSGEWVNKAEIEKPLFWEGEDAVAQAANRYLCGKELEWTWDAIPGKSKFLFRLIDRESGKVVIQKSLRKPEVNLSRTLLTAQKDYRILILGYDNKGKIELIRDEVFSALSCQKRPLPDWQRFSPARAQIFWRPRLQSISYQNDSSRSFSATSLMGMGAAMTSEISPLWQQHFEIEYYSLCSSLPFCQDQVEASWMASWRTRMKWSFSGGLSYQNLSVLNMRAFDDDGREVEDRVHLFTLLVGGQYRGFLWRKEVQLQLNIGYSPYGMYQAGDPLAYSNDPVSGYRVDFFGQLFFSSDWQWQVGARYRFLQAVGEQVVTDLFSGPAYSF